MTSSNMTPSKKTALSRKIALALGAVVISAMTLTGSAEAKPKFNIDVHIGGWGSWGGNPCHWYLHKYFKTGNYYWKKKYKKCMWMYF